MLLSELLIDVDVKSEYEDREITDITDNTKKVGAGMAFVCVKGAHFDGHAFADEAVKNGAAAIIAECDTGVSQQIIVDNTRKAYALMCKNYFGRACDSLTIIGITGTNGKTSTAFVIKDILSFSGIESGLIGTVKNMVGEKSFHTELTTPDPHDMHELFKMMTDSGIHYCVMETSSQAFHQMRLSGIHFKVGVFTNLTQDHLDYHGTIEEYMRCKKMLFENCDTAVINSDDSAAEYMKKNIGAKLLTYGIESDADFKADKIELHSDKVSYTVNEKYNIEFFIPGEFSVYNSLAAFSAAAALGGDAQTIADALKKARPVAGRLELLKTDTDYGVIIDYAHTPDGLEKAIEAVRGFTKGKVITVFGCGGDRDKTKRPKMAKTVTALSDVAVITTDNPRTEDPDEIIKDVLVGADNTNCEVISVTDRTKAIEKALAIAAKGDTVLLAGKGHETYQIVGHTRNHYDEREIVAGILKKGE